MSWLLDIIIIAIIAITVYFAAKNGFVKTAISAGSFLIALAITMCFASPLADTLKTTSLADTVEEEAVEEIEEIIYDSPLGIEGVLEGDSLAFNTLLFLSGYEIEEIDEFYASGENADLSPAARLAKKIAEPIIDALSMLLAIVILYIGSRLVLAIIAKILDCFMKLPVLKSFNTLFGIILGVILSLFRVFVFCFIVNLLISNASFLGSDFIASINPENTILFDLLRNVEIFGFLF